MKISKEKVDEIVKLYETMSIDKISKEVNISRHTVNRILKDSGIQLRSTGARKDHFKGEKIKSS
jgi:transposase